MRALESIAPNGAISVSPGNGIDRCPDSEPIPDADAPEAGANPGTGTHEDDWFVLAAWAVFGKKEAGHQLHMATGWPRTSCYAFVAREPDQRRKPNSDFLRILFRSKHGRPFRNAFMAGCDAEWWIEEQRAAEIGRGVVALIERK